MIHAFAAKYGFDAQDQNRIEQICRKSSDAVVRGLASLHGGVNTMWTRDDFLGGVEDPDSPMAKAVAHIKAHKREEEIIREREEAVAIWKDIVSIANEITSGDASTRSFIRVSCAYGAILYDIIACGWTLMLKSDLPLEDYLDRYDAAWESYRNLAKENADCPTLYRDCYCRYVRDKGMIEQPGMGASVNRLRAGLQATGA